MKGLAYLFFIIGGFLSLIYLIVTFVVWMDLLGSIPGILVSIFLFFIALIGMPVVAAITQHDWSMVIGGYLWAGFWVAGSIAKLRQNKKNGELKKNMLADT